MNSQSLLKLIFLLVHDGYIKFCQVTALTPTQSNGLLLFELHNHFDHDPKSYTQGLYIYKNFIYESSGNYGKSSLRIVDPESGKVLKSTPIHRKYFAEGITVIDDLVYMLTWKEKTLLIFDANDLELLSTRTYETFNGEGWGLTHDRIHLIVSDGSNRLTYFLKPTMDEKDGSSLKKVKHVRVTDPSRVGKKIEFINELEMVDGYIYANIWYQDIMIKINPASGRVVSIYDLSSLYPMTSRSKTADCLNGIAYNSTSGRFLLTGKWWPNYFDVRLDNTEAANDQKMGRNEL